MAMMDSDVQNDGHKSNPRASRDSLGEQRPPGELVALLAKLKAAQRKSGAPDYDTRIEHLDKLERAIIARKHDIAKAIGMDFGVRSKHESLIAEVMIVVNAIKHARAHLHEWMETEPREVSWMFLPGRAEVVMQPVGVVGIISPWNYPVQLALGPLVSVLAAGNRAIIKPSELVPDTAELLKTLISETFAADHVVVVTGGVDVSEAVSQLPLDHLVFTGSTRVGKIVMRAAAENLTPVTLELGGKSPAIVGESFSIAQAAQKIMVGKCFNAGQTCIAPDYVMVPKGRADAFVEECRTAFAAMYPTIQTNPDYTAIINDRQYERLQNVLKDARERGAKVVELNPQKEELDPNARKMCPHLVLHAKDDSVLMQDEIFGPILPIRTYETLDEAIAYVNDHPRPLALYLFDHDQKRIDKVLRETIAGGVCVNETMLHIAQDDLPFGGVGPSGMGHYHAKEGFDAFTKKKPIFYQSRINGSALLRPPYGPKIDFALKLLLGK
ncbi:MAG TPA: coniferyl aldehyde dehydrogenase [Labilithrix sp.]|nr:coniferyl aldehyde dehydrogenase [Labilithrix sp.]